MNGWYIACPRCGEINRGDGWGYIPEVTPLTYIKVSEDGDVQEYEDSNVWDEGIVLTHACKDGDTFQVNGYTAEDFLMLIENNAIVDVGTYWEDNPEDLEKVAKKNGLKVEVKPMEEELVKIGEIRIIGQEDEEVHKRTYFPARTLDDYKKHAKEVLEEFFKGANKKDVEDFIEKQVFPAIEKAWVGEEYIEPMWENTYYIKFELHEIPSNVVEKATWDAIRNLWNKIAMIKVPKNKIEDVGDALDDEAGHISVASGEDYALRVYADVNEEGGVVLRGENGDTVYIDDLCEHDYIYDPFWLLYWLEVVKDTVEELKKA